MRIFTIFITVSLSSCHAFSAAKMGVYRDKVKKIFYHAYDGYLEHAYPYDELMPISCTGTDTWGSFSLTLIDAMSTLLVMGNHSEFERAADMVLDNVNVNANVNVSVFETNIRVIGGLVSAHLLSTINHRDERDPGWPCNGRLLGLAERFADKLLPAFNTKTGMPYGTVNLKYGVHKQETPITCTAAVGTYIIEFGALSRLTGKPHYERVAMKALNELYKARSDLGLVGNHINVQNGAWTATDAGIGAGVDSYFEYLAKAAYLFQKPQLMQEFNEYVDAINRYVRQNDDWFMWVSMSKGQVSMPIFQSLEAFWPGVLTLTGAINDAARIMLTYNTVQRQYGFVPEFYNIPNQEAVKGRSGYPLRPEMAESLMYLYRATKDPTWLQMGADLVDAIEHSARTRCGYATVHNAGDHVIEDRMESFFLSETTKYLYLLFDEDNFIHNTGETARVIETAGGMCTVHGGGYIFNTEAHPIDPGALHCCSKQRANDRALFDQLADDVDLLDMLGLKHKHDERGEKFPLNVDDLPTDTVERNRAESPVRKVDIQYETGDGIVRDVEISTPIRSNVVDGSKEMLKPVEAKETQVKKSSPASELTESMIDALKNVLKDWDSLVLTTESLKPLRNTLYNLRSRRKSTKRVSGDDDSCDNHDDQLHRWLRIVYGKDRRKMSGYCAPSDAPPPEHTLYKNDTPVDMHADTPDEMVDEARRNVYRIQLVSTDFHMYAQEHNRLLSCQAQPFMQRMMGLGQVMSRL